MTQTPSDNNKTYNSSPEDVKIDPEVLEEFLSRVPDGPLRNVEEIILSEPIPRFHMPRRLKSRGNKRGPRSRENWNEEIRRIWGHLFDEKELEQSWLAQHPVVQKLAASEHGGRTIGSGLALQALLKKALVDVQQYDMEAQTREILMNFPKMRINEIASQLELDRSYLSRRYVTRAVNLLTKAFQRLIDRSI